MLHFTTHYRFSAAQAPSRHGRQRWLAKPRPPVLPVASFLPRSLLIPSSKFPFSSFRLHPSSFLVAFIPHPLSLIPSHLPSLPPPLWVSCAVPAPVVLRGSR